MKTNLLIILSVFALISQSLAQELNTEDGLYYKDKKIFTGQYKTFDQSGIMTNLYNIVDGKLDGLSFVYHENGNKKEQQSYKNGQKDGQWITWNMEGSTTGIAIYNNGKKDGCWIIWDDNGTKRYEMNYKDGQKVGKWLMWNEKGELISTKEYE